MLMCVCVCVCLTQGVLRDSIILDSGRISFIIYYVLIQIYESVFIFVTLWSYMCFTLHCCTAPLLFRIMILHEGKGLFFVFTLFIIIILCR